ncbi:hypothetical protein LAJ19_06345 [Deinococcus taeanensis]|uniref:hypothetical protein n=1 Tax=Deinococcus taeanensis TaxID=2737050 RepID=UPI001CDC57C2|nr:hypothetical protein [Deinococcus taeanensis]UBV43830.1 hypothetical protein LAJ19_06345 [Deinococcus taeanensis]
MLRRAFPVLPALLLCGVLSSCLPAPRGPELSALSVTAPGSPWTPADLLDRSLLPAERVLPLEEAIRRAPVGSVIVACWTRGSPWGQCTHVTRKIDEAHLTEETGALGVGATQRPLTSLLVRDLVLVLDVGVRGVHLPALRAEAARLQGAPYLLNGQGNAFDCATYQNALQRAAGLPDAVPFDTRWGAYLPLGALLVPTTSLLWAGVSARVRVRVQRSQAGSHGTLSGSSDGTG